MTQGSGGKYIAFVYLLRSESPDSFSFPPRLNKLHYSLLIGGILLLILATHETQCVGKSGGISLVKKRSKKFLS
jgi:hypothetical protein